MSLLGRELLDKNTGAVLLFVSLVTILANTGTVQSTGSCTDVSICSNVTELVFEIYNGSAAHCLINFTAVLTVSTKDAYCRAFWDGLQCAAKGLTSGGDVQICLNTLSAIVDANPPVVLQQIVQLTGLQLSSTVTEFANASDTCNTTLSTYTPDISLCSDVNAIVLEIYNGSVCHCLNNLTAVLAVTTQSAYCGALWDGLTCAAQGLMPSESVQACLDAMKQTIDSSPPIVLNTVVELTGLQLPSHVEGFANASDKCDLSLCSNVSALVGEITNGSLSNCLANLTFLLFVTEMDDYCRTFWDGLKCAAKGITTENYIQECLDDMRSIVDANSSVILDYVIEQTGLNLSSTVRGFANQTNTCNSSYSNYTYTSAPTNSSPGTTPAPSYLEPSMCGNVTVLVTQIVSGLASDCISPLIRLLLEQDTDKLCVIFWDGLKCVAERVVEGSYRRACLNEMKKTVDQNSSLILTQIAAELNINLADLATLYTFAGIADTCALTASDNLIVCTNNNTCTSFSASLHCDVPRSTCMKDEVETCTDDADCRYSLLHCLVDVSNSFQNICTPVVETCSSQCNGHPLTSCISNHGITGVTSSVCRPQVICTSNSDCTFINNLECTEQVCTCMLGYTFIGGQCVAETTADGVLRCTSNHTCSQVFSELYCNVTENLCRKKVPDSCTTPEDCSHSLLDCVNSLCYPVMTSCTLDSDCVSYPFTYCKSDHGLTSSTFSNGVCVPRNCSSVSDCSATLDSEVACLDSVCDCRDGYDEQSGTCSKVLGKVCTSSSGCPLDFAECSSSPSTCKCKANFMEDNDICIGDFLHSVNISETSLIYVNNEPVTQFKCTFDAMVTDYIYEVKWLLGGSIVLWTMQANSTTNTEDIVLKSTDVSGTFLLNDMMYCSVRVLDSSGREADFMTSAGFTLLQIDSTSLALTRGFEVEFSLTLNFPYGCSSGESCTFDVLLYDSTDDYTCSGTSVAMIGNNTCGCKTVPKSMTDVGIAGGKLVYSPEVFKCYVTTKNDFYTNFTSPVHMMLKTAFYGRTGSFPMFEGNLNQQVTVDITQQYSGIPMCVLFGSGFLQTFDKKQVNLQSSGPRTVTVYTNVARGTLTEIKTEISEWSSNPSIRGLFVKAGKDVFEVYHTAVNHTTGFRSQQSDMTLLRVSRIHNQYYSIRLPFGTEVLIHVDTEYTYSLSGVIVASPGDYSNARGLCGNFNGDPTDDFLDKSGNTVGSDVDLVYAWEPSASEMLEDSTTHAYYPEWPSTEQKCVCHTSYSHADQTCAAHDDLSCRGGAITRYGSPFTTTLSRRKREVIYEGTTADIYSSYKQPATLIEKRSIAESGERDHHIAKRDAVTYCAGFATDCPFINITDTVGIIEYQTVKIYCESDYTLNNTVDWLRLYCIPVQIASLAHLYRDITFRINNQALNSTICTGGCLNGGTCTNGACQCPTGIGGSQCSLIKSYKPEILSQGSVSVAFSVSFDCHTVTTTGSSDDAKCRISVSVAKYQGNEITFEESYSVIVDAEIIDFNNVRCCLPSRRRRRRSTTAANTQLSISTSNDGVTYSDTVVVTRIDSTCQNITTNSNGSTYIQLVSGYCFIDGACVVEGDANPSSSCQYCTTSYSYFNWNDTCIYSKKEEGLPVYAIALIAVAGVAILVIIIGALYICFLRKKVRVRRRSVGDVIRNHLVREPSTGKFVLRQDSQVSEVWKK